MRMNAASGLSAVVPSALLLALMASGCKGHVLRFHGIFRMTASSAWSVRELEDESRGGI
jgi:hypothetical protein